MNKRKVLSGLCGLAVVAVGIWLEAHGMKLASQLVIMTAFALAAPIAVGVVRSAFRTGWLGIAIASTVLLHLFFLWNVRRSLPFSGLGVAIIFGTIECFVLLFVTAKLMDVYANER